MEDKAEELRFWRSVASEERCWAGSGSGEAAADVESVVVGGRGRWETQSCTRRETWGLERRLCVLRLEGLVVIIMLGEGEKGVEAR